MRQVWIAVRLTSRSCHERDLEAPRADEVWGDGDMIAKVKPFRFALSPLLFVLCDSYNAKANGGVAQLVRAWDS